MQRFRRIRLEAGAALCLGGWLLAPCSLHADEKKLTSPPPEPGLGERVAVLDDPRINESSGLALSRLNPSLFWTLNDSGGEPCLFAIDRTGKTRAKVRIPGAANFDWEDIASGPGQDGKPALFIGDIGDNVQFRPTIQVYQIPEPLVAPDQDPAREVESAPPRVWHLSYPGKPKNAESLMVHPHTGQMFIVTKSDSGDCALFAAPVVWQKDAALPLTKVVNLEFPPVQRMGKRPKDASLATAGDISPDGQRLVIATYSHLHEWRLEPGEAMKQSLERPATILTPVLVPQLEAVCYGADSATLWFTSERLPTPLFRITR